MFIQSEYPLELGNWEKRRIFYLGHSSNVHKHGFIEDLFTDFYRRNDILFPFSSLVVRELL